MSDITMRINGAEVTASSSQGGGGLQSVKLTSGSTVEVFRDGVPLGTATVAEPNNT